MPKIARTKKLPEKKISQKLIKNLTRIVYIILMFFNKINK